MGNQLSSSSSSGRSGKLVLAAGTGMAAAALAWKCHGFLRRSKDDKEMRKKLDDSSQKTVPAFADFCALVVVMGTWRLWSLNDLSKISATGTNREQFTDMQSLPNQSMSTSIDSNSATGISQLQELEAECEEANYGAVLVAHADNGIGSMDCNNKQAEQQNQDAEPKGTKRRRGKRGAKKNKSKLECYSCGEKEYFTQECELKETPEQQDI